MFTKNSTLEISSLTTFINYRTNGKALLSSHIGYTSINTVMISSHKEYLIAWLG